MRKKIPPNLLPTDYALSLSHREDYRRDFIKTKKIIVAVLREPGASLWEQVFDGAGFPVLTRREDSENPVLARTQEIRDEFLERWGLQHPVIPYGNLDSKAGIGNYDVGPAVEVMPYGTKYSVYDKETMLFHRKGAFHAAPKNARYASASVADPLVPGIPIFETDIKGGRWLHLSVDISHSWERLQGDLKAIIHAAQSLTGRDKQRSKERGEEFWKIVDVAKELGKTASPAKIAVRLSPGWRGKAIHKKKWEALNTRITNHLMRAKKEGLI